MNNSYNQQLVEIRREKNLTLKEAAKGIGISSLRLFLIENGYFRARKKVLEKIESFYQRKIDYSNNNEYPGPFPAYVDKKEKSKKKRLIATGIISAISVIFIIIGSALFVSSVRNKDTSYGATYVEARKKAFEEGGSGRDLVTDLEYYYLEDASYPFGKSSICFYKTNSILYFNNATFSNNISSTSLPSELGMSRYHYQFGGGLNQSSYICAFTYGSYDAGLFFSCEAVYENKPITKVRNLNIITKGSVEITNELAVKIINVAINDAVNAFTSILSTNLGKPVNFYNDFLPAREKGRINNFVRQVMGLSLLIPSLIVLLFSAYLLVISFIKSRKSFLLPLEDESVKNEKNKPLPKDINVPFGIPDFVILKASDIIGWASFILLIFCTVGKYIFPLPDFLTNTNFLSFLGICYSFTPFLTQLILFGSIKKEQTLFYALAKHLFVFLAIATFETTLIGITDTWGYDFADIVYNFIPGHIYLVTTLNYVLFLFLFFKPSFIRDKKPYRTVLWRLLSLIPLGIIIAVIIVGNYYELFYGVKRNIYVLFWCSNSKVELSLLTVLFIYASFFIKLYFQQKYGLSKAHLFYNGNRYIMINNIVCCSIIVLVAIFDLFFKNTEYGYYLGLGDNLWILALIPFIIFCLHGPNTVEIAHTDDAVIERHIYR